VEGAVKYRVAVAIVLVTYLVAVVFIVVKECG
jgi:hypothetical protein